jgi:hypothetical protein
VKPPIEWETLRTFVCVSAGEGAEARGEVAEALGLDAADLLAYSDRSLRVDANGQRARASYWPRSCEGSWPRSNLKRKLAQRSRGGPGVVGRSPLLYPRLL